jgi:hypothetical protein
MLCIRHIDNMAVSSDFSRKSRRATFRGPRLWQVRARGPNVQRQRRHPSANALIPYLSLREILIWDGSASDFKGLRGFF